jgi:hypothetical protein
MVLATEEYGDDKNDLSLIIHPEIDDGPVSRHVTQTVPDFVVSGSLVRSQSQIIHIRSDEFNSPLCMRECFSFGFTE